MIKNFIHRLLERRHPWRKVGFNELSELYTSMMFRALALSLVGIFIPIYLYQMGVTLQSIMIFYATIFGIRVFTDLLMAFVVARYGPKHSMALSYAPQALGLSMLVTYDKIHWPLWLIALMLALAAGLFFISYHVDFSKIKHSDHGGKEVGFMTIMEKLGSLLGPITGGIIALLFGVKYSFIAAIVFLVVGMIPLFMTKEPVKTKQKISFRNFKIGKIKYDMISYGMMAVENNTCLVIWPLFVALYAITGNVYFKVGILASVGVVISVVSARVMGKLIDNKKGLTLFRYSLIANTFTHLLRPLVQNIQQVFVLNLANEAITPGYRMPYFKGWYDHTDDFPGYRIVYISIMESANSIARTFFYFLLAILTLAYTDKQVLSIAFIIGAISNWFISMQRFPALRNRK